MNQADTPIIVGAGPVGLGAALFLAAQGQAVRVVEMHDEPSRESRALAVNPRTLEILEPTGLSRQMLKLGKPIRGARFYRREREVAVLPFAGAHPEYPFMLALSQAATERLLARAFESAGGMIERGKKLVDCRRVAGRIEALMERSTGGPPEVVMCPWLLAADGAHSTVRQQLGIEFPGSSFAEAWHLADAPLKTTLSEDRAHVFFVENRAFLFMIRVVDPELESRPGNPVWRVISNRPEPLSHLVLAEQAGPPVWNSSFHISHRIVSTMASGGVYLAGDAAHIHSPVGARGMNLGLEDAWVFAKLVRENRLADYDRLRRPVDRRVVRKVEFLSRAASSESVLFRMGRKFFLPKITRVPFLRSRIIGTVMGLDHGL